jgi:hypothetical protein
MLTINGEQYYYSQYQDFVAFSITTYKLELLVKK